MSVAPQFPVDYDEIRNAMVAAIQLATDLDQNHVIVEQPEVANYPRPTRPYFGINPVTVAGRYGNDVMDNISDENGNPTDNWNFGGPRLMIVDFNCYGRTHEEAYAYMVRWQGMLDTPPVQELLRASGIAVCLIGATTNMSQLLNAGFEGRAHMTCRFGIASNLQLEIGSIGSVTIDGQISGGQSIVETSETVSFD